MKQFCYILAILMALCITPNAVPMMKNDMSENDAPVIEARLKSNKVLSLKTQAAKQVVNLFDPNCNTHSVEQRKSLRNRMSKLPVDVQNRILKTILKEKPRLLEQILNAQPAQLTPWDARDCVMSPDSKFCYLRARRKQSADEPHYLIKVNTQTLEQEELLNIEKYGVTLNPQCTHMVLSEFNDDTTRFRISLYNLENKQSKLLLEANSQPALAGVWQPGPKVFFSPDNRYVTVNHQGKAYNVNLSSAQLCGPVINGEGISLNATRIILNDPRNQRINVVSISNGTILFSAQHHCAEHCACWPGFDESHLYTVNDKTLNVYNLYDGTLLKRISFERPISGIDSSRKKLHVALMAEDFSHNIAKVDAETGTYKICARKQHISSSINSCCAGLSSDSLFSAESSHNKITLRDSKQDAMYQHLLQKMGSLDHRISGSQLSHDNSLICAHDTLDSYRGTERHTCVKLLTHRSLTNNTPLRDILALLILEAQKREDDPRDGQLWGELLESQNPLIRELADKRYTNDWKETALKYLSYFNPG